MELRILGDYNLIKTIGQGTLGTVYLAEHRFMKKQYVLKVLPEELASDRGFLQRFEEEVGILASLDHSNIVKIYNVSFAQGQYFLVTDCIVDAIGETTNLAQHVIALGRRLEEEEIFHILKQVADPLDYAHNKKIGNRTLIHRGLKPNNILVGKGDHGEGIHLSDFGLSRLIGTGAVLTRTYKNVAEALGIGNQVVHSKAHPDRYPNPPIDHQKLIPLHASFLQNYAFLAPEQKRLDLAQAVDAKADVYAFGVLAYFLLMSELPEGIFEMPSARQEYYYNWDLLIQDCLQSHPAKRPDYLMQALEAVRCQEKIIVSINLDEEKKEEIKLVESSVAAEIVAKYAIQDPVQVPEIVKQVAIDHCQVHSEIAEILPSKEAAHLNPTDLKPIFYVSQLERPRTDLDPAAALQVDPAVKLYRPEYKDIANIRPLLTEMAVVQGSLFYRGSLDGNRDEMPRHEVTVSSFAIDVHPVTNEQFVRFLEVMGGEKDTNHHDIIRLKDSRIKRSAGKLSIESGYAKHPVVGVTWYGAVAYAKWVGKRLPAEVEWEIAARGGQENGLYPTGEDIEKTQANFFSSDTTAVMSYAPNGYGLYDMAGNVYEWCHDWYGYNYYEMSVQEPDNPKGPLQGVYRVLRGGCWKSLKEDLRCSRRHRNNPGTVNGTYGFRCAADVQLS